MRRQLLPERMRFHLINSGSDAGEGGKVRKPHGVEVRYTNGADLSGVVGVLERAVRAVVVAVCRSASGQVDRIDPVVPHVL